METKYIIMMMCFDTPEECLGDYYLDMVNDVFDDMNMAKEVMEKCIEEEIESLNEDTGYDGNPYTKKGNGIYLYGSPITLYTIQKIQLDM